MSTTTPTRTTHDADADGAAGPDPHLSFGGVLRSEAVKLVSVRSTVWMMLAAAFGLLAFGLVNSGVTGGLWADPGGDAAASAASAPLAGSDIAQLIVAALGVLVITSEYATRMIRATFTAVPARLPVLAAKAAVVTVVTFVSMLAALVVAFFLGEALISTGDVAAASISDPGVLGSIVGTAGYLTGVALIGLAVGTILRGTASAISVVFGLVFLLPGLGGLLLPASWRDDVLQFFPANAGSSFSTVHPAAGLLSAPAGLAVFAAWILVPMIVAAVMLKRRSV